MFRFCSHKVALIGDIEKAFLMVHTAETDKDVLRFLWIDDIDEVEPQVITLRFIEQCEQCDPAFTQKFLQSIYVDDFTSGDRDVDSTFELYMKSKLRLKDAGFNLRKCVTNSQELQTRI